MKVAIRQAVSKVYIYSIERPNRAAAKANTSTLRFYNCLIRRVICDERVRFRHPRLGEKIARSLFVPKESKQANCNVNLPFRLTLGRLVGCPDPHLEIEGRDTFCERH